MFQQSLEELLIEMAHQPLSTKRYSTSQYSIFNKPKNESLLFNFEMLLEFIEKIQVVATRAKALSECITLPIPSSVKISSYRSMLFFIRTHCHTAAPELLAPLIFHAAAEFVQAHPGSIFHAFMMIRQLRNTFKFDDTAKVGGSSYNDRMLVLEQEAFTRLIRIQQFLEPENFDLQQALSLISDDKNLPLLQRKAALLSVACYHISTDSIQYSNFDEAKYNEKNFRLILSLSTIHNIQSSKGSSVVVPRAAYSISLCRDPLIQTIRMTPNDQETEETLAQPKKLSSYWECFFKELTNESKDAVIVLTEILITYHKKNSNMNMAKGNLLSWFDVVRQYHDGLLPETPNMAIVRKSYADLYAYLDLEIVKLLPAGAMTPFSEKVEEKAAATLVVSSMNAEVILPSTPVSSSDTSKKLSPMMERFINHPASTLAAKEIIITPPPKNSEFVPLSAHTEKTEGDENMQSPAALTYEGSVSGDNFYDDNDSVASDRSRDNDIWRDQGTFYVENSDFAKEFELMIRQSSDKNPNQENKKAALSELISAILAWGKKAHDAGLAIRDAAEEIQYLTSMQKSINSITLKDVYQTVYTILHIVMCASMFKRATPAGVISFYQDAGAAFILLRKYIAINGLEEHSTRLEKKDNQKRSVIQQLLYRDETKASLSMAASLKSTKSSEKENAIKQIKANLPYIYKKFYDARAIVVAIKERKILEDMCADLLVDILGTPQENLSFDQVALAIWAVKGHQEIAAALIAREITLSTNPEVRVEKKSSIIAGSPYYNALQFLAASYEDTANQATKTPVIILRDKENIHARVEALYTRLIEHVFPLMPMYQEENLGLQQIVIYRDIESFIEKINPGVSIVDVDGNLIDDDTHSVGSRAHSVRSHRTAHTVGSNYTFKTGSSGSGATTIQAVVVDSLWNTYCSSQDSLDLKGVKFVLKHFASIYSQQESDHQALSFRLLTRVFDWLRAQPFKTEDVETGGKTTYGVKEKLSKQEINSKDWELINYIEASCKQKMFETFVQYCQYQIKKHGIEEYNLKSYELKFIMKNLKFLYSHCSASGWLNTRDLWSETLGLIYPTLDQTLTRLENKAQKIQLEPAEIKFYENMMIGFPEVVEDATLIELKKRISELGEKASKPSSAAAMMSDASNSTMFKQPLPEKAKSSWLSFNKKNNG